MTDWRPLKLIESPDYSGVPEVFRHRYFHHPHPVMTRGEAGTWDEFGVRDPALLVDENGYLKRDEHGSMVLFYGGSHGGGHIQCAGRAVSSDGVNWKRDPQTAVLEPRPEQWDNGVATTAWVLYCRDGLYRMYYRGARTVFKDEGIGLAISKDGVHFEPGDHPLLTREHFRDIPEQGMGLMAVINVITLKDGRYLLTFEGTSASYGETTQIFGAVSEDGVTFTPLNDGFPIFTRDDVKSWPTVRVANPRLYRLGDDYAMMFNGQGKAGLYSLGIAFTRDFKTWTEYPGNPVLMPSRLPGDHPFSARLEGGVLIQEELEENPEALSLYLMGIPFSGTSHQGGAIGKTLGIRDLSRSKHTFRSVYDHKDRIHVDEHEQALNFAINPESRFPARAHFCFPPNKVSAVRGRIGFTDKTWLVAGLTPEMGAHFQYRGIIWMIKENKVWLATDKTWSESFEIHGNQISFEIIHSQGQAHLKFDDREALSFPYDAAEGRDLVFRVSDDDARIWDLQIC